MRVRSTRQARGPPCRPLPTPSPAIRRSSCTPSKARRCSSSAPAPPPTPTRPQVPACAGGRVPRRALHGAVPAGRHAAGGQGADAGLQPLCGGALQPQRLQVGSAGGGGRGLRIALEEWRSVAEWGGAGGKGRREAQGGKGGWWSRLHAAHGVVCGCTRQEGGALFCTASPAARAERGRGGAYLGRPPVSGHAYISYHPQAHT